MTGQRLRRLLALIVLGAIVIRAVGWLRGNPTRTFDRPRKPVRPQPGGEPRPSVAVAVSPPTELPFASSPATKTDAAATTAAADAATAATQDWVAPVDGACPDGYPVKAKLRSGIFHLPGMSAYDRTTPDRCYADADTAAADGLRVAKR